MTGLSPCRAIGVALLAAVLTPLPVAGAGAVTGPSPTTTTTVLPPPGSQVSTLQLDTINAQFLTAVEAEFGSAQQAAQLADGRLRAATGAATAATNQLVVEETRLAQLTAGQAAAARRVQTGQARLRTLAVAAYESGGPGGPVDALLRAQTINDLARSEAYFRDIADASAAALKSYVAARNAATRATLGAVDALEKARAAKAAADQALAVAQDGQRQAAALLADRQSLLTLTRDAISTPNTDIPRMVLDAYQRAAQAVQAQGCQLAWWALAGIGRIESDHGRAEDAHITPTGDLVPPIIGVPLTGSDGTALITDANGQYAHAEGPMQFIPSTWARWGADGNGDGTKDVDNIYDAALGAARYLCASSTQLGDDAHLEAAYLSYNNSTDYVTEVLAFAHSYELADRDGLIPPLSPAPLYTLAPAPPGGSPPSTTTTTAAPARKG